MQIKYLLSHDDPLHYMSPSWLKWRFERTHVQTLSFLSLSTHSPNPSWSRSLLAACSSVVLSGSSCFCQPVFNPTLVLRPLASASYLPTTGKALKIYGEAWFLNNFLWHCNGKMEWHEDDLAFSFFFCCYYIKAYFVVLWPGWSTGMRGNPCTCFLDLFMGFYTVWQGRKSLLAALIPVSFRAILQIRWSGWSGWAWEYDEGTT